MALIHTKFKDIKIHTAKCDTCNKHNTSTMKQCIDCGQNFCDHCWRARGSDGTHILNSGDMGYAATQARAMATAKAKRPHSLDLLRPKKERVSVMKSPSPRTAGRSKRTRRRTVVIEDSESEDDRSNQDGMKLDAYDDGQDEQPPEPVRKIRSLRRGKQRELDNGDEDGQHVRALSSRERSVSRVGYKYPDIHTILETEDAAQSLLELASGSSTNFTPVNTRITPNTFPRIDLHTYGNDSRCQTLYSPVSPNCNTGPNPSIQPNTTTDIRDSFSTWNPTMEDPDLSNAWYISPNGTAPPVSQQYHPYPVNPDATSRFTGHDSQGTFPLQEAQPQHITSNINTGFASSISNPPLDHLREQTLFINDDASSSEEPITSAGVDQEFATNCSSAVTTAMDDKHWQAWLKSLRPDSANLDRALSTMEEDMDRRGQRLFDHDTDARIWNDALFNKNYFNEAHVGADGGRAVAKANLNTGHTSRPRAKRARTERQQEASEEGEITEGSGAESG